MIKGFAHLALLATATSCAMSNRAPASEVFVAVVAGERTLVGVARPRGYGGDFELKTLYEPAIDCAGNFRYDDNGKGRANFKCTNNESGMIKLQSRGGLSGDGYGNSTLGPVKALFGYSLSQINRKMEFPGDRALQASERGFKLIPKRASTQ